MNETRLTVFFHNQNVKMRPVFHELFWQLENSHELLETATEFEFLAIEKLGISLHPCK